MLRFLNRCHANGGFKLTHDLLVLLVVGQIADLDDVAIFVQHCVHCDVPGFCLVRDWNYD
jgi:hypothetical protein